MDRRSRLAAYAVIASRGRILLVRASDASDFAGTWWLPGGGVEFGEHPADAVVREVLEETGLGARIVSDPVVLSDVHPIEARGISLHTVRVVYRVEADEGPLRAEQDGTSDVAEWVAFESLGARDVMPFVHQALAALG